MADYIMELACCESVILNEIAQGCNQKQIAQTYALAMRSSWPTDWAKVNKAIIERWSFAGLNRIKNMAWSGKCFDKPATLEADSPDDAPPEGKG
jgi:hypothetical protein